MHSVHELLNQWINGNKKEAVCGLLPLEDDQIHKFMRSITSREAGSVAVLLISMMSSTQDSQNQHQYALPDEMDLVER